MVQEGRVPAAARSQLEQRFAQVAAEVLDQAGPDLEVHWIEIPTGSGYTGGVPSTSSVTSMIVPDSITTDQRTTVLESVCREWTEVTGCSTHEVVVSAINASYKLQTA